MLEPLTTALCCLLFGKDVLWYRRCPPAQLVGWFHVPGRGPRAAGVWRASVAAWQFAHQISQHPWWALGLAVLYELLLAVGSFPVAVCQGCAPLYRAAAPLSR